MSLISLDPLISRRSVSEGRASSYRRARPSQGGRVLTSVDRAPPPPLDPRVVKESYILGETLPGGETETIEFKSAVEERKKSAKDGGSNVIIDAEGTDEAPDTAVVRIIRDKVARYVVAFLNSSGGAILFGVEDDGKVTGCLLTVEQRAEITKVVDVAVEGIDPQVEVGAVRHRFVPVMDATCDDVDPDGSKKCGGRTSTEKFVVVVTVRPESSRLQPAYYPTSNTLESFIRRAESVFTLTPTLVVQREDEFRAEGRTVQRTWRHVVRKGADFDGLVGSLRSSSGIATVPRVRLIASVASAVLDGDESPRSRIVAVVGDSGTGKSTLMASLICGGRNKHKEVGRDGWKNLAVCGWFFCGSGAKDVSAPAFVGHLAAALAVSHHTRSFRRFVRDNAAEVLRTIEAADPRTAFRGLLRMCRSLADQPVRRLAFCVDGIEEAISSTRAAEKAASSPLSSCDLLAIPDLIFDFASEAPPWLVFVVTARSLSQVPPEIPYISADEGADEDIPAVIALRRDRGPRISSLLTEDAALHLAEAAGSNFQFVHSILNHMEGHGWGSSVLQQLMRPSSSDDSDVNDSGSDVERYCDKLVPDDTKLWRLYSSLFRLQFPTHSKLQLAKFVLELFLAACRPLLGSDIASALSPDVPADMVRSTLSELFAYLTPMPIRGQNPSRVWAGNDDGGASAARFESVPLQLQHLSFQQWLLDSRDRIVPCNVSRGHARLAMWHLAQAHSLSSRIFLHERFPPSFNAAHVDSSVGSAPSQGVTALLEQEGIYHVLEAAIHLGQYSASSGEEGGIVSALLRDLSGPALVACDSVGRNVLHFASRYGNKAEYLAALKLLLDASTTRCPSLPIESGLNGKCPLVVAAHRGHEEAFALLVQAVDNAVQVRAVEPDDAEEALDAALWAAASSGAVGCVALLVGGEEDLSTAIQRGLIMGATEAAHRSKACPVVDSKGCTALWLAVATGNSDAVRVLLTYPPNAVPSGANYTDLGAIESDCCEAPASPLYLAASQGNAEIVRLIKGHASPCLIGQVKGERWPTLALSCACILGNTACVDELLSFPDGPDSVNLASSFPPHRTALLEAVWNVRVDCVQVLLNEPGVDALLAEEDGGAAIHEACYWGKGRCSPAVSHSEATEILKMLVSHHFDNGLTLDVPDNNGCTPLCYAAAADGDQSEWVAMLLKKGASPCVRPWGGSEALGFSEEKSKPACLMAQPWGGTAIEEATSRGHTGVVAVLCAAAVTDEAEMASGFVEQASRLVNAVKCASTDKLSKEAPLIDRDILMMAGGDDLVAALSGNAKVASGKPRFALQQHKRAPTLEPKKQKAT